MKYGIIKDIVRFVIILAVQVLVLNQIHLFDVATPLLYVYMLMLLKRDSPRWLLLVVGFAMGIIADVFANTPGVSTISLTLMGFIRPYVLMPFLSRDAAEDVEPSMTMLGPLRFFYYSLIMVFIYCLVFFGIETFSLQDWVQWLLCTLSSTALSTMLILVIENARKL